MTEAIGSKEQIVGLFFPVSAIGTDKDDLVLHTGVEGIALLAVSGIDLKYAGLTFGSVTDRL